MFGYSWGAANSALALAMEPRLRAAVLYGAGVQQETKPEASPVTFLPRVTAPVLVIAGALDSLMPYEDSAKPFFDRLGTQPPDKKLIVIPASHYPPVAQLIAPTLEWLDGHLGPVQ